MRLCHYKNNSKYPPKFPTKLQTTYSSKITYSNPFKYASILPTCVIIKNNMCNLKF
jgi:hypothetical protein